MPVNFVTPKAAAALLGTARFLDCRWSLKAPDTFGVAAFKSGHIPGATFIDMEKHLTGKVTENTGKHPLPPIEDFGKFLHSLHLGPTSRIVVYDDAGGGIAGRLWWMLRCVGLDGVSILEAGIQGWQAEKLPLAPPAEDIAPKPGDAGTLIVPKRWEEGRMPLCDVSEVLRSITHKHVQVVDARPPTRYGSPKDGPPADPDKVPGHIPNATNHPFASNFARGNVLKPADALKKALSEAYRGRPTSETVMSCGSGITACINIAVSEHVGLGVPRLYVGSWSHWSKVHPTLNHDGATP